MPVHPLFNVVVLRSSEAKGLWMDISLQGAFLICSAPRLSAGLMAHRARVLKGEKTIRMHYANCATFNADFDGDEINLHLPQDQMGRAEGYEIVHADQQFIVPTDGKPIR